MESALGEFLAIEKEKLQATNLFASAQAARQAFDILKPALADADEARRRDEAEMKTWIAQFRPKADQAVAAAEEARRRMPPIGSHRISAPVGQASRETARAVVSIARTRQRDLSVDEVEELVRQALAPLGGISQFVKPGQTVLLKPNQTLFLLAGEGSTTDPRVVAALARLSYEAGASKVMVGESSGGGSRTEEVMHITGVKMLARRAGAEIVDFQTCAQREVGIPNGKIIKQILLPAPLLDADVVINLPKLKTHNWDWISGALKNWVGIVRPDVREAHHDAHCYDEYIDLHFRVPAHLHVMDAIIRGVGNGPGANRGEFYGGILASTDPVAMDAVAAQILGFDPAAIGFVLTGSERGLGVGDPTQIAVVGVPLAQAIEPGEPPEMGVDIYDANVIVGTGLTRAGTLGHFKSMGDIFQAMGTWMVVRRLHGRPTILIGDAEDPLFTAHLNEGPYVVIDDAAPEKYKHHPEVLYIPGHPVLHNLETLLLVGLRIPTLGRVALGVMGKTRTVDTRLEYEAPRPLVPVVRRALDATRALSVPFQVALSVATAGALLFGAGFGLRRAIGRRAR
jgi:uncharacterized protein (DUF362 family)